MRGKSNKLRKLKKSKKSRKTKNRKGGLNLNFFGKTYKNAQVQDCESNMPEYYNKFKRATQNKSSDEYKDFKKKLKKCYELERHHYTLSPIDKVEQYYKEKFEPDEKQMAELGAFINNDNQREGISNPNDPWLRKIRKYLTRRDYKKRSNQQTRNFRNNYENAIDKDSASTYRTPIKTNSRQNALNSIIPINYNIRRYSDDPDPVDMPQITRQRDALNPDWEYNNQSDWREELNDDDDYNGDPYQEDTTSDYF
jgi:hypothetical protein